VAGVNPSTTRTVFRSVAIAEAISWAGLLIAMFFKWVVQDDPHTGAQGGVPIMGPIHGVIFVAYVVACLFASRSFGWGLKTTVVALAASIPPFFTYVFEVVADRRGLLGRPVVAAQ
jgi:integral membrane protein